MFLRRRRRSSSSSTKIMSFFCIVATHTHTFFFFAFLVFSFSGAHTIAISIRSIVWICSNTIYFNMFLSKQAGYVFGCIFFFTFTQIGKGVHSGSLLTQRFQHISNMVFRGQDAWRSHKVFHNLKWGAFPGLGKAVAIYGVYMMMEYTYKTITMPSTSKGNH